MTTVPKKRRIRRVLVALDASPDSLAAAGAAARLAALLGAELAGLFVEDMELLRLSRSPMARRIDLLTAAVDQVESLEVERQLRVQAARARQALARLAEAAEVQWTFQVARGRVAEEIQAASDDEDLVSLGRVGWSLRHRRMLGRTARALLAKPRRFTLLIQRTAHVRAPVAVVFDGSEAAEAAVDLAHTLTGDSKNGLAILMVGRDVDDLRARLIGHLGEARATAAAIEAGEAVDDRLARLLVRLRAGLVVVPFGSESLDEDQLQDLLAQVDCPVLAVS